ncbi:MAG: hypothetical protein J7M03_06480 [Candidatus Desulfofervidaceae bacterium]|nr:hypothetical protein [Candidatus Desulfofervidaceae bacterium]
MNFKTFLITVLIVWFGLVVMGAFKSDRVVDLNAALDWPAAIEIEG